MKRFPSAEIEEKIGVLDLQEGDVLYIHNSLLKFGIPSDVNLNLLPKLFYDAIRSKIGDSGTIIVPTFNFDFCKGLDFDRQNTASKSMGAFSEYVRKLPDTIRSTHPMQSLAINGAKAQYLTENDTPSAFSLEGAFDRMRHLNTKILLLGADFYYISMMHWIEEHLEVPYRYWKTFGGNYTDAGVTEYKEYKMYVRDLDFDPVLDHIPVEKEMRERNMIFEVKLGGGELSLISLNDFVDISQQLIKSNPYVLVTNHPDYGKYSI